MAATDEQTRTFPRWLKRVATVLLVLALLVGMAMAALPGLLSSDTARTALTARLQSVSGRPAHLDRLEFSWSGGLDLRGLRLGTGGPEDADFLCSLDSLRLAFGFDSLWSAKVWVDLELSGLKLRHDPARWPGQPAQTQPPPSPVEAVKQGLEALRRALTPTHFSGDLRAHAVLRDITVLSVAGDRTLQAHIPELLLEAPSLRNSPVRLTLSAAVGVDGKPASALSLQLEASELVDRQRLLRPGSAKLMARVRSQGLSLDVNGGLDTGLKGELALDLAALLPTVRPLLPPTMPQAKGNIALTTLVSQKGQDALAANLVITASELTLSGGSLGTRSIGPVSASLLQEAAIDLAAGTLELPGSLSILERSSASWLARATDLAQASPQFSLRLDALKLDLAEIARPLRELLPPDLKLSAASLESGPIQVSLHPSAKRGSLPALAARLEGLALRAGGIQMGPAPSRASLGSLELRADSVSADLPEAGPGAAHLELTAIAENLRLAGPKPVSLRRAELTRFSVRGKDLGISEAALFGLTGGFTVEQESSGQGLEVAGLLTAPSVVKSQRLTMTLPAQKRLDLELESSRADMPGLRLLRIGKPPLELPLVISAQAHAVSLSRADGSAALQPAVGEASLSAQVGRALATDLTASLSAARELTSRGRLTLDAEKLAALAAALLPQRAKATGSLALDWDIAASLPQPKPGAVTNPPLLARLKELNFLHRAQATLSMRGLGCDLPLAAKDGRPAETLRLRGLTTPRPLRLTSTNGLGDSALTGSLAFGPLGELPGVGPLRRPVSGLFTVNAAQQGLRSAQVSQMLSLDGLKLSQNLSLTLDKLDAVLDADEPLTAALERMDATASLSLATGLDALPQVSDKGLSGRGSLDLGADLRLSGGRSLTLALRANSPGLDLRLGPDLALSGLTSTLALRRRYALRPGLACPAASAQAAQAPLSEQVFDLFPDASSTLSAAEDFALRTLYDSQSQRRGTLGFAALDLRTGPLPLSLRDFALVLDTASPLPAVQSFRLGLFGGSVLGRAKLKGGSGAYTLDADCAFTGIDTARMLPGRGQKDLGDQAELSGRVALRLPLTPDPETLLTRLSLRADITKVGPRTLERALYALDPEEQNETIVQQRRLMGLGYPRNLRLNIAYGNLSLSGQVEVKGFRLDIPPIDRLSVASLPVKDQLGPALRPIPALLDVLDLFSATTLCREPLQTKTGQTKAAQAKTGQAIRAGRFDSLNLLRTAPAQGATP